MAATDDAVRASLEETIMVASLSINSCPQAIY
jgi:hypothetical protein